jgi:hypothetical protein
MIMLDQQVCVCLMYVCDMCVQSKQREEETRTANCVRRERDLYQHIGRPQ